MQGVAARDGASHDPGRARASVAGQTTNTASPATTSLPTGRIVTARFAGFSADVLQPLESVPADEGAGEVEEAAVHGDEPLVRMVSRR